MAARASCAQSLPAAERVLLPGDVSGSSRCYERLTRRVLAERPEPRVGEQSLGVGLRVDHQARQLGKTGAYERNGQRPLRHPVHCGRYGLQLVACQELHLVDQEHDAGLVLSGRLAELGSGYAQCFYPL
jgi:hypothetical protein